MGADGGTIASSGVMPEVITKLYLVRELVRKMDSQSGRLT